MLFYYEERYVWAVGAVVQTRVYDFRYHICVRMIASASRDMSEKQTDASLRLQYPFAATRPVAKCKRSGESRGNASILLLKRERRCQRSSH